MNSFYKNGLLDILKEKRNKHSFRLLSEDVSILLIFDKNFNAQCLITESYSKNKGYSEEEKDAIFIARYIEKKISIPSYFIRYNQEELDVNSIITFNRTKDKTLKKITLSEAFSYVNKESLFNFKIVDKKNVSKQINDKVSTPFHRWQRSHLNYTGFPVDLDMVCFLNNELKAIIELKRSYINNWTPFKNDMNNYLALAKVSDLMSIDFFLLFVQQEKKNDVSYDDYNKLYLYNIFHKIGNYKENSLIFNLNEFMTLDNLIEKDINILKDKPLKTISM